MTRKSFALSVSFRAPVNQRSTRALLCQVFLVERIDETTGDAMLHLKARLQS